jgi:signal transduction histidine kinase
MVSELVIAILDGEIFLADTPGGGCTFTITIPCCIAELTVPFYNP